MAIMLRSIAKAPLIPIAIFPAFLYLDGSKFSRLALIVKLMAKLMRIMGDWAIPGTWRLSLPPLPRRRPAKWKARDPGRDLNVQPEVSWTERAEPS
jgi:hypothetical protein